MLCCTSGRTGGNAFPALVYVFFSLGYYSHDRYQAYFGEMTSLPVLNPKERRVISSKEFFVSSVASVGYSGRELNYM